MPSANTGAWAYCSRHLARNGAHHESPPIEYSPRNTVATLCWACCRSRPICMPLPSVFREAAAPNDPAPLASHAPPGFMVLGGEGVPLQARTSCRYAHWCVPIAARMQRTGWHAATHVIEVPNLGLPCRHPVPTPPLPLCRHARGLGGRAQAPCWLPSCTHVSTAFDHGAAGPGTATA